MGSPLIEAACEPGDIFQDPSVGAVNAAEIREARGNIDSHLTALEALKVHPINTIEHGTFMLLLNAVDQAYDLSSADDSDNPNDPIVRAHRDSMEALRYIHSFLYPDIGCPCEDDPADCAHRHTNPQTGKCLECPGYADAAPVALNKGPAAIALIHQIARLTKDGEDGFVMENDDAVSTVHGLIDQARSIVANRRPISVEYVRDLENRVACARHAGQQRPELEARLAVALQELEQNEQIEAAFQAYVRGCLGCGAIQDCTPDCIEANNIVPLRHDERKRILVYAYREVYDLSTWANTHGLSHLNERFLMLQRKLQDLANTEEIAGPLDEAITIARLTGHGVCEVCTAPARFSVHATHDEHHHSTHLCGNCLTRKLSALRRVVMELVGESLRGIDANMSYHRMCDIALSPMLSEITATEKVDEEERKAWARVREMLAVYPAERRSA